MDRTGESRKEENITAGVEGVKKNIISRDTRRGG